jgi:dCTP deaminase
MSIQMMSNVDILKLIKNQSLRIHPFDKRLMRPAGVTLRLGSRIFLQYEKGPINPYDQTSMQCYKPIRITEKRHYILEPNDFALAVTFERIGISGVIGAMIEGTSSLGRLGLSVTQTASVVDTGHGWPNPRPVVLELRNGGKNSIELHYMMKIARMIFFSLSSEATLIYDRYGKYRRDSLLPKALKQG